MEEARARMIAKRFGGNANGASTGGGGSSRRKKKSAHKTPTGTEIIGVPYSKFLKHIKLN